jgi:ABC-type multidrug transport system fused ATPase/permease subunit
MLMRFSSVQKDESSEDLIESSDSSSASSGHLAIKNMTISIEPGEKVAICGSSGS